MVGFAATSVAACGNDSNVPGTGVDDRSPAEEPETETTDGPVDAGTVVPDQGGFAPVDNLDEDVNEGGIGNPQSDVDNNQPSQQDG